MILENSTVLQNVTEDAMGVKNLGREALIESIEISLTLLLIAIKVTS